MTNTIRTKIIRHKERYNKKENKTKENRNLIILTGLNLNGIIYCINSEN